MLSVSWSRLDGRVSVAWFRSLGDHHIAVETWYQMDSPRVYKSWYPRSCTLMYVYWAPTDTIVLVVHDCPEISVN